MKDPSSRDEVGGIEPGVEFGRSIRYHLANIVSNAGLVIVDVSDLEYPKKTSVIRGLKRANDLFVREKSCFSYRSIERTDYH